MHVHDATRIVNEGIDDLIGRADGWIKKQWKQEPLTYF